MDWFKINFTIGIIIVIIIMVSIVSTVIYFSYSAYVTIQKRNADYFSNDIVSGRLSEQKLLGKIGEPELNNLSLTRAMQGL